MADVGFGVEPGARKFSLDFVPLVNERYFLACHTSALTTDPVKQVLSILRGNEFRALINNQRVSTAWMPAAPIRSTRCFRICPSAPARKVDTSHATMRYTRARARRQHAGSATRCRSHPGAN